MQRHRALIVDDERLARRRLAKLLQKYPQVQVVAEAESLDAAVAELTADPSLSVVFLDIQMPGGSGFELFNRLRVRAAVVFITAFEAYALRAFEVNALDYLLKPIDPARLDTAIERLPKAWPQTPPDTEAGDRICLPLAGNLRFVHLHEMACIRAEADYSEVCLRSGQRELVRVTMREWESRLPNNRFIRVHRSTIVSVDAVTWLGPGSGSTYGIRVEGVDETLTISRSRVRLVRAHVSAAAK